MNAILVAKKFAFIASGSLVTWALYVLHVFISVAARHRNVGFCSVTTSPDAFVFAEGTSHKTSPSQGSPG